MKLYEEMKMWEALWDDPKATTYTDDEIWDLIDGLIAKIPENYLFEYGGFTDESYAEPQAIYSTLQTTWARSTLFTSGTPRAISCMRTE